MNIENQMDQQKKQAQRIAIQLKPQNYGIQFTYEINDEQKQDQTRFGLKTIKDLLNMLRLEQSDQNLYAFEDKNRTTLLGDSVQLKEQTRIYVFQIQQNNMVYIHVFGKKEQMSFYVNRDMTLQELINNYNKEFTDDLIDITQSQYILSHYLHPGGYIRAQMGNEKISTFLQEGDEGLFRLEKQ